jgi:hypothetical protein
MPALDDDTADGDKAKADDDPQKALDEQVKLMQDYLYIKNQFLAFCLLFTFVQYLDFLTVSTFVTNVHSKWSGGF